MIVKSVALLVCSLTLAAGAMQAASPQQAVTGSATAARVVSGDPVVPGDYVIGPDDVLAIVFWKEKEVSADNVVVRPDGKISLPIGNEILAAGLTPEQLRAAVASEAVRFLKDPTVNVIVKQINSRRVFITGMVAKPGFYPLTGTTTVMQLIAVAGGLQDYAKGKEIVVVRGATSFPVNYQELAKGKRLAQNLVLKPGDTVVVP